MVNLRFYREGTRWYADVPNWTGSKAELEMVEGADVMLDIIGEGHEEVCLTMDDKPNAILDDPNCMFMGTLKFDRMATELENGAFYTMTKYNGNKFESKVWLCDVTKFVFGEFPKKIKFAKLF